MTKTCDSLGVFAAGEEVAGFSLYGLWELEVAPPLLSQPDWVQAVSRTRLHGDDWLVFVWDFVVATKWPTADEFANAIDTALDEILRARASVAWGAVEGGFVDPPALFDPQHMSKMVWTARTTQRVWPAPRLDGEFRSLKDSDLKQLHEHLVSLLSS